MDQTCPFLGGRKRKVTASTSGGSVGAAGGCGGRGRRKWGEAWNSASKFLAAQGPKWDIMNTMYKRYVSARLAPGWRTTWDRWSIRLAASDPAPAGNFYPDPPVLPENGKKFAPRGSAPAGKSSAELPRAGGISFHAGARAGTEFGPNRVPPSPPGPSPTWGEGRRDDGAFTSSASVQRRERGEVALGGSRAGETPAPRRGSAQPQLAQPRNFELRAGDGRNSLAGMRLRRSCAVPHVAKEDSKVARNPSHKRRGEKLRLGVAGRRDARPTAGQCATSTCATAQLRVARWRWAQFVGRQPFVSKLRVANRGEKSFRSCAQPLTPGPSPARGEGRSNEAGASRSGVPRREPGNEN
jgi:hypothetical protein